MTTSLLSPPLTSPRSVIATWVALAGLPALAALPAPAEAGARPPEIVSAAVEVLGSSVQITLPAKAGADHPALELLVTEAPLVRRGSDLIHGRIATIYLAARPETPELVPEPIPITSRAEGISPQSTPVRTRNAPPGEDPPGAESWAFFGESAALGGTAFRSLHLRLERVAGGNLETWRSLTVTLGATSPDAASDFARRLGAGPPAAADRDPRARAASHLASDLAPDPRAALPGFLLGVSERGVYAVSRANLHAIGWTGGPIPIMNVSLTRTGSGVPVWFRGAEDGWLDADHDAICFYADPVLTPYAATATYWLSFDAGPGLALAERPVRPAPGALSRGQLARAAEANREYWVGLPSGDGRDHWFWNRLRAGELIAPQDLGVDMVLVPQPLGPGVLRLELQGKTSGRHELAVEVNGVAVGAAVWEGAVPHSSALPLSAPSLRGGTNHLRLTTRLGSPVDLLYLDRLVLTYEGALNLTGGEVAFTGGAGPQSFRIAGLTGDGLTVLDTTDPLPVRLAGVAPETASAAFADSLAGRTYFAFAPAAYRRPPRIDIHRPPALLGLTGADYLAVAPAAFRAVLEPLLAHHRARGMAVAVVEPEEAYSAFGGGDPTPAALRTLFAHALAAWSPAPRYVLLAGDATYDYRGFLGPAPVPLLPTLWVETPNLGQMGSDNALADLAGDDGIPELAIGRLPGRTPSEIAAAVDKTLAYARVLDPSRPEPPVTYAPWLGRLHVVADDGSAANPFEQVADRVAALAGARYGVEPSYLAAIGSVGAARAAIQDRLEAGSLLAIYIGHGNVTAWAAEELFAVPNASALTNGTRTPVVLALNCLNGYFTDAESPVSLAEAFLQNARGGAVGMWAPAGLGYLLDEEALARGWIEEVFGTGERTVGDAILRAKARHAVYPGVGSNRELLESYTWFGDPALAIALPAPHAPPAPRARATTAGTWLRFAPAPGTASLQVLRWVAFDLPGGDLEPVAEVAGDRSSWVDSQVEPGVTYRYAIRAVDGAGFTSPPSPPVQVTAGKIAGDGQPPVIQFEPAVCIDRRRSLRAAIGDEDGIACERLSVRVDGVPIGKDAWTSSCTAPIEEAVEISIPIGTEDEWPALDHVVEISAEDGAGEAMTRAEPVIICAPLAALGVAFAARPGRGTIALDLTFSRPVTLEVTWVSALGRMIRRHTASPESEHHVVWDGRDSNGRSSASGVYWVRLHAHAENGESWRAERKALLLR